MNKLRIIFTVLFVLAVQPGKAELIQQTLLHEKGTRSFYLYIPSTYDETVQTPLLVALHGRTGNGQRMARLTEFNKRADTHGFLVVYPDGQQKQWNYLHGIPGANNEPDDSDFLEKLTERVSQEYNVDNRRIYVTGISNGGFMVQRLACNATSRFAAFASVAASGYATMPQYCKNNNPVNMLYLHGTEDRLVPWRGLAIKDESGSQQQVTLSMTDTLKFWSHRNGCSADVSRKNIQPDDNSSQTRVSVFSAGQCKNSAEVVLYAIMGGGHNWPGVEGIIPDSIAGQVNMDIHTSDVIWSFFKDKKLETFVQH